MDYLYVLLREGYDDPFHTEYYLDEHIAKNRMVEFAIRTRCTVGIYVYRIDFGEPEKKLKFVKRIELAQDDNRTFWKIWLKQDAEGLSTDYILRHPEIMHDCLEDIEVY